MNQQATIEKMKSMRLQGMVQTYHSSIENRLSQDYTIDQYVALLVDQEWEYRHNKKMNNLISAARFKAPALIRNVDFTSNRGLDKNMFDRLASLDFLARKENIILTGPSGTGKSYLAQAIGHQACISLIRTKYYSMTRLIDQINLAKLQGTYHKLIKSIQRTQLLILDDFGLHPFDQQSRKALMDIVEDKYDQASIIITSQIPVSSWHSLIGEGTIADAILDRLVHSSHRIQLSGESLRKNKLISST